MNEGIKGQKPAGSRPGESKPGRYRLTIPLDASGIEDREGAAELKVAARDRKGRIRAQSVKIDAKGQGAAALEFDEKPGALSVLSVRPTPATTSW